MISQQLDLLTKLVIHSSILKEEFRNEIIN